MVGADWSGLKMSCTSYPPHSHHTRELTRLLAERTPTLYLYSLFYTVNAPALHLGYSTQDNPLTGFLETDTQGLQYVSPASLLH